MEMILFALFANFIFSKIDNSIFQIVSLHCSNFSINFGKLSIQYPHYFSISPSCFHPKLEFHNLRSVKSFMPFIFSNSLSKFDLTLSSCLFSSYLSSVIFQNNDDCQQLVEQNYNDNSKEQLKSLTDIFLNSNPSCINILNCEFRDITGSNYNDEIGAALRLITGNNGGVISIYDTQFHNCRSYDLENAQKIGGALYICTKGNQHCPVILQNIVITECNAFSGAAFVVKSECPVNYTEVSCRNINITNFINLPREQYYDQPRNVVDFQNCYIKQFANVLFESMDNERFLMNLLSFSNCDGKVSSIQFTNIIYDIAYSVISVTQDDKYSHTLIFEGVGFQNVSNLTPFLIENPTNLNLNVIIDNLYYNGDNYLVPSGSVSVSVSITHTETNGMNAITPPPTPTESAEPTLTDSPTPSISKSPTPSTTETPYATLTETPTESAQATPSEEPTETPIPTFDGTISTDFAYSSDFSPSQNYTDDNSTDDFDPPANNRSVSGKTNVGLIVGCTIAGIVLLVAIVLLILFFCFRKVPCCACCEKTAFEPSDEESKTELCFFDEKLNQAN